MCGWTGRHHGANASGLQAPSAARRRASRAALVEDETRRFFEGKETSLGRKSPAEMSFAF